MYDTDRFRIQVYSYYDGWEIQVLDLHQNDAIIDTAYWSHDDAGGGVGGEAYFAQLLKRLGFSIYIEEVL